MVQLTQDIFTLVKHYESLHDGDLTKIGLQPKLCPADVWTIGYGHALTDPITGKQLKGIETKDRAYKLAGTITEAQAEWYLQRDMALFADEVNKLLKLPPTDIQLSALTSLAYNIGIKNLAKSTLIKKHNAKDFGGIGVEFTKWTYANGKKLDGLIARRASESLYYFTGKVKFFKVVNGAAIEI